MLGWTKFVLPRQGVFQKQKVFVPQLFSEMQMKQWCMEWWVQKRDLSVSWTALEVGVRAGSRFALVVYYI